MLHRLHGCQQNKSGVMLDWVYSIAEESKRGGSAAMGTHRRITDRALHNRQGSFCFPLGRSWCAGDVSAAVLWHSAWCCCSEGAVWLMGCLLHD